MQEKTVVGLFDTFESAKAALNELTQKGTPADRISLLANDSTGRHPSLAENPAFAREDYDALASEQSRTVVGAEVGVGLGGVLGLLVGVGTIAIPGIGPLIAAGTWAVIAAGAAAGGVVGGAIGALTEHGISDKDAHLYAEGLRRGGTLVTVRGADDAVDGVAQVFKAHGAVDIGKRSATWIAEGWVAFDPDAPALTSTEQALQRVAGRDDSVEHHHRVRRYFNPAPGAEPIRGGASNVATHYGEDESRP